MNMHDITQPVIWFGGHKMFFHTWICFRKCYTFHKVILGRETHASVNRASLVQVMASRWTHDEMISGSLIFSGGWGVRQNLNCSIACSTCFKVNNKETPDISSFLGLREGNPPGWPMDSFQRTRAPFQYPIRRLIVRSREVSKPQNQQFKLSYRCEIWQARRQQCCRGACQISERSDYSKYKSRGIETSRDLTIRRLIGCWNGAQYSGLFVSWGHHQRLKKLTSAPFILNSLHTFE